MSLQHPGDPASKSPNLSLFPGVFRIQTDSLMPYYSAMAYIPQIYRPPVLAIPQYLLVESPAASPLSALSRVLNSAELAPPPSLPQQLPPASVCDETTAKTPRRPPVRKTGRDVYKCNKCERTYLSYPALYTHIKLKHPSLKQSQNQTRSNRGRPRKNVLSARFTSLL